MNRSIQKKLIKVTTDGKPHNEDNWWTGTHKITQRNTTDTKKYRKAALKVIKTFQAVTRIKRKYRWQARCTDRLR